MTLWIVIGIVAIALLGFACAWVLKARSGLEIDAERASLLDADAHLESLRIENANPGRGLTR